MIGNLRNLKVLQKHERGHAGHHTRESVQFFELVSEESQKQFDESSALYSDLQALCVVLSDQLGVQLLGCGWVRKLKL